MIEFIVKNQHMEPQIKNLLAVITDIDVVNYCKEYVSEMVKQVPHQNDEATIEFMPTLYNESIMVTCALDVDHEWITQQKGASVSMNRYDHVIEDKLVLKGVYVRIQLRMSCPVPDEDLLLYRSLGKIKKHTYSNSYESLTCDI